VNLHRKGHKRSQRSWQVQAPVARRSRPQDPAPAGPGDL